MKRLELLESFEAHDGRAWCVAWHPKGNILASCGEDKNICLWKKDRRGRWRNKTTLRRGHSRTIREISWSPCGNFLASASFDATIGIWENQNGNWECTASLEGHENEVKSVAWSSNGSSLASCSRDKSVWIWDVVDGHDFECATVLNAHTQDVKKVRWHPFEDTLASVSYDNTVKIFQDDNAFNDWVCQSTLTLHTGTIWSLCFDRSGSRFATVSEDKTMNIWQKMNRGEGANAAAAAAGDSDWKSICTLSGFHDCTIYDVSWCKLSDLIVTGSGDDSIRIFEEAPIISDEVNFEMVYHEPKAHTQDVNSVAWNPTNAGILASCSDDGFVKIWKFYK